MLACACLRYYWYYTDMQWPMTRTGKRRGDRLRLAMRLVTIILEFGGAAFEPQAGVLLVHGRRFVAFLLLSVIRQAGTSLTHNFCFDNRIVVAFSGDGKCHWNDAFSSFLKLKVGLEKRRAY